MIADFFRKPAATFFTKAMVFSRKEKAVVKNDFVEREKSAYHICEEFPT